MISRKTDYALRTLLNLAEEKDWSSVGEISNKARVSRDFIAKICQTLSQVGIIESKRGKGGGIRLKDGNVKLAEIISLFEPRFALNKCLNRNYFCYFKGKCKMHNLLHDINDGLMNKLRNISINQVAGM